MIKNDWGKNKMSQLSTQGKDKYPGFLHNSSSSILNANEKHEIHNTLFFVHCTYSDFPCLWPKSWGFSKTKIGHYGSDRSWKVHFSQCTLRGGCKLQKLYFSNLQWIWLLYQRNFLCQRKMAWKGIEFFCFLDNIYTIQIIFSRVKLLQL